MSASRTLERKNKMVANKRSIMGRAKPFRRVLSVVTLIAETGDGPHKHAIRYHATKGRLTWHVPMRWMWRAPQRAA